MGERRGASDRGGSALRSLLVVAILALPGCGAAGPTSTPTSAARPSIGATRATPTVAAPPADFALMYSDTRCGESDIIDTFVGTFTVVVPLDGRYRGGTRAVPFALTAAETAAVDGQIVAMDFFAYPPTIGATTAPQQHLVPDYTIRVRRAGVERAVA